MNKKLTPHEALNNLTQLAFNYAELDEQILSNAKKYYGIIGKALQEYQEMLISDEGWNFVLNKDLEKYNKTIKKLQALEIIKEKNVDVGAIKNCVNAYAYNDFKELTETKLIKREKLTQEEFDTVKEVLL